MDASWGNAVCLHSLVCLFVYFSTSWLTRLDSICTMGSFILGVHVSQVIDENDCVKIVIDNTPIPCVKCYIMWNCFFGFLLGTAHIQQNWYSEIIDMIVPGISWLMDETKK